MLKGILVATALGIGALVIPAGSAPADAAPAVSQLDVPKAKTVSAGDIGDGIVTIIDGIDIMGGTDLAYMLAPSYYGCAWLRHRAYETGSHYWRRRYRWCRGW